MIRTYSLRWRLLIMLILAMLVTVGVGVYTTLDYADHEAEEIFDARLLLTAKHLMHQLLPLVQKGEMNDAWLAIETVRGLENAWVTEFSEADGLLSFDLAKSNAHDQPAVYIWLVAEPAKVVLGNPMPDFKWDPAQEKRIITFRQGNREWRVLRLAADQGRARYQLFIAQRDDVRKYLTSEVGGKLLERQTMIIPFMVILLWLVIRNGMRPLDSLSSQVRNRKVADLKPVFLKRLPEEILPLINAINQLLDRLKLSLESERSFTSDAAHELRTPLSALRNLSQIIASSESLEEIRHSTAMLDKSTERMSALLSQLLDLARLDSLEENGKLKLVSTRELFGAVTEQAMPDIEAKDMEISFEIEAEVYIIGNEDMLKLMLVNLISNAIKYGRSQIKVRVSLEGRTLRISIKDDGDGVEPAQLGNLFERFYRTDHAREQEVGCGLGLSIVKRVAELHGFEVLGRNRKKHNGMEFLVLIPASRWKLEDGNDEQAVEAFR